MTDSSPNNVLNGMLVSTFFNTFSKKFTISRTAKYIGSFMVTGKGHHDRAEIVRQKLEAARSYTRSKSIVLLISLNGIKVCRDLDKHVYMAHALRRISFATCDPEHLQFAFLAREPKAEPNLQYCHSFVTNSSSEAEELNNIVGEAFRIAYTQQQLSSAGNNFRYTTATAAAPSSPVVCEADGSSSKTVTHQQSPGKLLPTSTTPYDLTNGSPNNHLASPSKVSSTSPPPPSVVCKKPLPPLPKSPATNSQTCTESPQSSNTSAISARKHRSYEHHKHKHRSKEKELLSDASDCITNDDCSVDSGRHTGTNESLNSTSVVDHVCHPVQIERRQSQPPAPPPRGSSSLATFGRQRSVVDNLPTLRVSTTTHEPSIVSSSDCPTNVCIHSPSDDLLDGHIARPSSVVSHPESHHSYHIADHGVRAWPSSSPDNPASRNRTSDLNLITPSTNSSTTGCSITTSSSGSRQNSIKETRGEGDTNVHTSLSSRSDSTQSTGSRRLSRFPETVSTWDDTNELTEAPWYQPHVPREVALELLSKQPVGSFVVRDSGSHANCYALSLRFDEGSGHRINKFPNGNRSGPSMAPYHPYPSTGISHFLIQRTDRGGVRLKGLDKEWPSMSCLVVHLTVMPEMLPCPLRLQKLAANPAFSPIDPPSTEQNRCSASSHYPNNPEVTTTIHPPPSSSTSFCSSSSKVIIDEDEDYQRLSDFSAILADLSL